MQGFSASLYFFLFKKEAFLFICHKKSVTLQHLLQSVMKHRVFFLLAALLLAAAMPAQPLYVGSYNIRYQNDDDNREGNSWQQRCPVVCAQLNFEHPDIFGAQEVLAKQLKDMAELLTDYDHIGVGRDDGKSAGEHEVIFFDRQRIRLLDHGHFWLSETPDKPGLGWDAACTRICTWGKFRDLNSRRVFFFFNLHMDHVGVVARREGARLVVSRIHELAKGKPVILTGDFNVDQTDEIYSIFTSSGLLNDSYEQAQMRFAENGTFNAFKPERHTDSRIDHVFVSPAFTVLRYGVLTNSYWDGEGIRRLPSDHYPVFVRLE